MKSLHGSESDKQVKHCATFPAPIIERLRKLIPYGLVVDPFGGTGRLGLLGAAWQVISVELEPEWAVQGLLHGCKACMVADSRSLPFADNSIAAIATSPTYGNRMADKYVPTKAPGARSHETRRTYRLALGRDLTEGNSGGMQWGEEYRQLHRDVYREAYRYAAPGAPIVVNMKDHIRDGELQQVVMFHGAALNQAGFVIEEVIEIPLSGDQNTARRRAKNLPTVDHEVLIVARKPA